MDFINSLSYNNLVYKVIEYQKLLEKKGNGVSKNWCVGILPLQAQKNLHLLSQRGLPSTAICDT